MATMISSIIPLCLTDPLTRSNCYILVSNNHAVLIDPNNSQLISEVLLMNRFIPDYVILTHEHCDHIAGLNDFRKTYAAPVIASESCSTGIQDTTLNMSRVMEPYLYFKSGGILHVTYPRFTCQAADITFSHSYVLDWKGHHFSFISAPGHTPGSICILLDDYTLFSGDYFIPGEEVITRLPGGSDAIYEKKGKIVLRNLPEGVITYPGHGSSFILTKEVKQIYGLYTMAGLSSL